MMSEDQCGFGLDRGAKGFGGIHMPPLTAQFDPQVVLGLRQIGAHHDRLRKMGRGIIIMPQTLADFAQGVEHLPVVRTDGIQLLQDLLRLDNPLGPPQHRRQQPQAVRVVRCRR